METIEKEPVKISPATTSDVAAIQDVFYKTWLATYPNEEVGVTVDDVEDRFKNRFDEERLEKRREEIVDFPGRTLVAKDAGKIIALCRLEVESDHNRLQALYVIPEYQGKGIGTMLWNAALERFNLKNDTFVSVATYNTKAIEYYKKLGFEDTGKRFTEERLTMKSGAQIPEMDMVIRGRMEKLL